MAVVEVRHQRFCKAKGRDARRCSCSPSARVKVHLGDQQFKWVAAGKLPKGWGVRDLDGLDVEGGQAKLDHDSGRRVIERAATPTLRQLAEEFLADIAESVALDDLSPNTLIAYRTAIRLMLPLIGDTPVSESELSTATVQRLRKTLADKNYARTTIANTVSVLSTILNDKAIGPWRDTNPCSSKGRRGRRRGKPELVPANKKALELDFALALLNHTRATLLGDMLLCAFTTGMRQREVAGLKVEHVYFRERRIEVANQLIRNRGDHRTKGEERTTVICRALGDRLAVRAEQTDNGYLFNSAATGLPWSHWLQTTRLDDAWEALVEGEEAWRSCARRKGQGWHVTRHTFATLLDQRRVRPLVIDALMGHKNAGVSFRYRHVWDGDFDAVTELLDQVFSSPIETAVTT